MAKKYIKKINLVNMDEFRRLGIVASELSLSQRNYTDKLITILRPAKSSCKKAYEQCIKDFVEVTTDKNKDQVKSWFNTFSDARFKEDCLSSEYCYEDAPYKGRSRRVYLSDYNSEMALIVEDNQSRKNKRK